jgi:hypothetical protein
MEMKPNVVRVGLLNCQVCVPKDWTDQQIIDFADQENPVGLYASLWKIRKEGDPERNPCEQSNDYVHVMLDL